MNPWFTNSLILVTASFFYGFMSVVCGFEPVTKFCMLSVILVFMKWYLTSLLPTLKTQASSTTTSSASGKPYSAFSTSACNGACPITRAAAAAGRCRPWWTTELAPSSWTAAATAWWSTGTSSPSPRLSTWRTSRRTSRCTRRAWTATQVETNSTLLISRWDCCLIFRIFGADN